MKPGKSIPKRKLLFAAAFLLPLLCFFLFLLIRYLPTSRKMSPEDYFGTVKEEEALLVTEDTIISDIARKFQDNWYLRLDWVTSSLNTRFYWDSSEELLLYTTSEQVWEISEGTCSYQTGNAAAEAQNTILIRENGQLYLSLPFLCENASLTYTICSDPDRIVLLQGGQTLSMTTTRKKCAVRFQGGIKSPILTTLSPDTEVLVLEELEHWTKIRTPDGYIGYCRKKDLYDPLETYVEENANLDDYSSLSLGEPFTLVWHEIDYLEMNANLPADTAAMSGVTVISPTWYSLSSEDGGISSMASAEYTAQAHEKGLQVWALISNFNTEVSTTAFLSSRSARQIAADYLITQAEEIGFDGINIDFEGIEEAAGPSYVQFIRELSILCREKGLYLSVDVPVPMDFSYYYNRRALGQVCDYVIMMGYDEHYYGSEAGSVASLSFERNGIERMLTEVPAEKIISGIPFYTRLWYTIWDADGTSSVTSELCSMLEGWEKVESAGITATWDADTEQPYAEWTDAEGFYCQIWLEDDSTVTARAHLVAEYALGGVAAWVLGQEADYVWNAISAAIA